MQLQKQLMQLYTLVNGLRKIMINSVLLCWCWTEVNLPVFIFFYLPLLRIKVFKNVLLLLDDCITYIRVVHWCCDVLRDQWWIYAEHTVQFCTLRREDSTHREITLIELQSLVVFGCAALLFMVGGTASTHDREEGWDDFLIVYTE